MLLPVDLCPGPGEAQTDPLDSIDRRPDPRSDRCKEIHPQSFVVRAMRSGSSVN